MNKTLPLGPVLLVFSALSLAGQATAQDRKGRLGTLPHGYYICSLPGDASGPAWIELPDRHFTVSNSSTYRNGDGSGTYLLTGKRVTFTYGPMKGHRYERTGDAKLQQVNEDGTLGKTRCIRRGGTG